MHRRKLRILSTSWMGTGRSPWYVSVAAEADERRSLAHLHQVLNCADYHFTEYTAGSQIILHDTYPIGINATWSTVWNTPCTPEVGDCGCDNCQGQLEDISVRVDEFQERLVWQERAKDAVVWSVPQAFGQER